MATNNKKKSNSKKKKQQHQEEDEELDVLVLIYQYAVTASLSRKEGRIVLKTDSAIIDKLLFNFDWKTAFNNYQKRSNFYWGFSVEDANTHLLEAKFETVDDADLDNIQYLIEVAVAPEKIAHEHFDCLTQMIKSLEDDDALKVWWLGDSKTEKKKSKAQKKQVLQDLGGIGLYQREDDIDLEVEDPRIPLEDALVALGFKKDAKKIEVGKNLKKQVRELIFKHHPDVNNGNDTEFRKIQSCKDRLQQWLDGD